MKKIISLLLAVMMIFVYTTALATDSDMTEKVLLTVKEKVGTTDDFKNFESNIRQTKTSVIYNFYWSNHKEDDRKNLNISALENGFIIDYYYYDGKSNYKDKPNLNRISSDEAKIRTKALIDKLNPTIKDSIRIISEGVTQDLYMDGFSFKLERYENDIRVLNNNGYVTVNSDATEIRNFNLSYDEKLIFPSSDTIIEKEDAQKLYDEKIGMVLEYKANYDYKKKEKTITPVYIPKETNKYINAINGEIEEYKADDEEFRNNVSFDSALKEEAAGGASLSDAEKAEFENLKGLKAKEELIKIINQNPYTKISDDMVLSWYNTSKSAFDNIYRASFTYEKTTDGYKYANVTLNMETGEILSFYKDEEKDITKKATLSDSEIKAKKDKAIEVLAGKKALEYKYDEESKKYIRYVNDIPFRTDNINIGISDITGEIRNYNISYTNSDFPSLAGVITASKATDELFKQASYNLAYKKMSSDNNAKLIYILDETVPTTINAYSGKLLNADNKEYVSDIFTGYTDIEGHYAKDAVNTLAKFGIRFDGNELKPNERIKQKDFIALLVSTFNSRSPIILKAEESYQDEYSMALRQNIIMPEEENPDLDVSREDAAKFMIRALGYEEIANIPNIYICPFTDVLNYKGYISILNGLKIINGNGNNKFNPKNALSRADAMIMIYNYLSR